MFVYLYGCMGRNKRRVFSSTKRSVLALCFEDKETAVISADFARAV